MTAKASQDSYLDISQHRTSDNQQLQTADGSTQTTAKIKERYTLTHMPTCVYFTKTNFQEKRAIPRIPVPMCDCLLKVMLGYDMSERDEKRMQAFEDCCVTVTVIGQNRAVSMPLKDLRNLLDTQEWMGVQEANSDGAQTSSPNGIPSKNSLETGARAAQKFGQTPVSRASDRQPVPTGTAKSRPADLQIRDQSEVVEISDDESDNAPLRQTPQHVEATGKVKDKATIGNLDPTVQNFLPGPAFSSVTGLESLPVGTLSQCLTCQRKFNNPRELTEHLLGPSEAHGCIKSTEPPPHTKEPRKDKYTAVPVSSPDRYSVLANDTKLYGCKECSKKFARKADLIRHARSHSGERPYPCEFPGCGQQFIDTTKLRIHERLQHSELKSPQAEPEVLAEPSAASSVCRDCPCCSTARNLTPEQLKLHLSKHRVYGGLMCRFCGKKFDKSRALIRHVTIHTGEKPFKCQFCPVRLGDVTKLKNHVLLWHKNDVIPEKKRDGLGTAEGVTKSDKELPIADKSNPAKSDVEVIGLGAESGHANSETDHEVVVAHSTSCGPVSATFTATSANQIVALSPSSPCTSVSRTVTLDESFIRLLGKVVLGIFQKNTTETSHTASTLKTSAMLQALADEDSSHVQCITQPSPSIQELGGIPEQTQTTATQHEQPSIVQGQCAVTMPRQVDVTQIKELVTQREQTSATPGQGVVMEIKEIVTQIEKFVTQQGQPSIVQGQYNCPQQKQPFLTNGHDDVVHTVDSWQTRESVSSGQMDVKPLAEVASANQVKQQGADVTQAEISTAPYQPTYTGQLQQPAVQTLTQMKQQIVFSGTETRSVDAANYLEKSAERQSFKPMEFLQQRAIPWKQASSTHVVSESQIPCQITPTYSFKNVTPSVTSIAPVELSRRDGNAIFTGETRSQHHVPQPLPPAHAQHVIVTCTASHPAHVTVMSSGMAPVLPSYALPSTGQTAAADSVGTESISVYQRAPSGTVRYFPGQHRMPQVGLKPVRYLLPKGHLYPALCSVPTSVKSTAPVVHLKSTQASSVCFCGAPGYMPTTRTFPTYFTQQHSQTLSSQLVGAQSQPTPLTLPIGGKILPPSVPQQFLATGPVLSKRHSQGTVFCPAGTEPVLPSAFVPAGTQAQGTMLREPQPPSTSAPLITGRPSQVLTLHLRLPAQQLTTAPLSAGTQNLGQSERQQQPQSGSLLVGKQTPRTIVTLSEHEEKLTTEVQGNKSRPTSSIVVTARQPQGSTTRPLFQDKGIAHPHSSPQNPPTVCHPNGVLRRLDACRSTHTPVQTATVSSRSSPHARVPVCLPAQTPSSVAGYHTPFGLHKKQLNGQAALNAVRSPWAEQTHDPITCTSSNGLRGHQNSPNGGYEPKPRDTQCSLVASQAHTRGTCARAKGPSSNPRLNSAVKACHSSGQLACDVGRGRLACVKRENEPHPNESVQYVPVSVLKSGKTSGKRLASGEAGNVRKKVRFAL